MVSTNRLALSAIALMLFATLGCTGTAGAQKTQIMGWSGIAGLALLIVVLLLAIGYMAAVFMHDDRLKAWVTRELGQVLFSAVIIVVAVLLVGSLDSWLRVLSLAGSPEWQNYVNYGVCCVPGNACVLPQASDVRGRACHIELASDYLQILYETARHSAATYLDNYGWYAFLSRMSVSTTVVMKFMAGLSFTPFAGLEMTAEFFSTLFDMAIKTMMLIRAQQMFLDFLWYPFFPVMISMGLVLRIFYFTRKLGGMLVAIALALYVVFPMFYVLSNGILWGFMTHSGTGSWEHFGNTYSEPGAGGEALPAYGGQSISPAQRANGVFSQPAIKIDLCNSSTQSEQDSMKLAMNGVGDNWDFYEGGRWYSQALSFATGKAFEPGGPIAHLALLMVFTLFIPFLSLMTSLAAFKVLSPMIGGDVEISLLSRLI